MDSEESDGDPMDFDYIGESDDIRINDVDFGPITPNLSLAGTSDKRLDFTDVYQRFGSKKALAPYITQPFFLRKFLLEGSEVFSQLEKSAVLAAARRPPEGGRGGGPSSGSALQRSREKQLERLASAERKLVINQEGETAAIARKKLAVLMLSLRERVQRAAPNYTHVSLSIDECIARAPKLKTLRNRKEDQAFIQKHHSSSVQFTRSLYSFNYIQDLAERAGKPRLTMTVPKELRVTVRVYRGRPPVKQKPNRNVKHMLDLYCLGSSRLNDVVGCIRCPSDTSAAFVDMPNEDLTGTSPFDRFLYVGNTFFTDDLDSEETKAKHYKEWLLTAMSINANIESLDDRQLMDVELRLGTPYLYKHGPSGCEHFVVFCDVRFLHPDDELDLSLYPRIIFQAATRLPVCAICGGKSTWQVNNSKRFPRRVNYLCDACNALFNYTAEDVQVEPEVVLTRLTRTENNNEGDRQGLSPGDDTE